MTLAYGGLDGEKLCKLVSADELSIAIRGSTAS